MDFSAFKRELVKHILSMAELPWAVEHARFRVRELVKQDPALFGDLPKLLEEAMKEKTNGND
jgi:hypothetical protein